MGYKKKYCDNEWNEEGESDIMSRMKEFRNPLQGLVVGVDLQCRRPGLVLLLLPL
jgi:hypothetical protein